MSRLARRFAECREGRRAAFVGFVTAGDPSLDRTVDVALAMEQGGMDVLELGVPFSDPVADGPVIQRASERALRRGVTLGRVLDVVERIRTRAASLPIVVFSYVNPLLRHGLADTARRVRDCGADAILATDLPPDEAGGWMRIARDTGLDTVFLAAPTSPDARLRRVAESSTGFVYAVSRTGVTGASEEISEDAAPLVARLRALTASPVALGFGISTPAQVALAASIADGVVVGSALVRFLEEQPEGDVEGHVRWLRSAS